MGGIFKILEEVGGHFRESMFSFWILRKFKCYIIYFLSDFKSDSDKQSEMEKFLEQTKNFDNLFFFKFKDLKNIFENKMLLN